MSSLRSTAAHSLQRHHRQGFSLAELLVVIGIMALLAVLVTPAFNAIGNSHRAAQSAYDLAELLELARNEAVTRQTYVWVAFENATVQGIPELRAVAVYSRDGSDSNTAASNLANLTRILHIKGISLTSWDQLKTATQSLWTDQAPASVAANSAGVPFSVGTCQFQGKTVTFTPRGQAMLKASPGLDGGYDELIDISFRQSQGTTIRPDADDAAVVVNGSSGTPKIVRLQ